MLQLTSSEKKIQIFNSTTNGESRLSVEEEEEREKKSNDSNDRNMVIKIDIKRQQKLEIPM